MGGKLFMKENLLVQPASTDLHSIGQWEGFTHLASLIYLNKFADTGMLTGLVSQLLSAQEGILFGITTPLANGLMIRILGNKAEQLHDCLKEIAHILPQNLCQ